MKKEERIVEILNEVSEKYIEEAAPSPKKNVHLNWKTWASMAAAIVCAVGISVYSFNHFGGRDIITPGIDPIDTTEQSISTESTEQEELQYHEDGRLMLKAGINADGMGFEGLMFYDISESSSANPWTKDCELEMLPVFKNLSYTQGPGYAIWLDNEEMLAKAEAVAEALDAEIISTEYRRIPAYDEWTVADRSKAYETVAATELGEIEVIGNGDINIFFEPSIELPSQYSFTWSDTSKEDAKTVMGYLMEQYQEVIGLEQPVAESWGHYSFNGSQHREYYVFEGEGKLEEQILHYNFAKVEFSPNDAGNLWIIRCGNLLDSAEKIDNYPIISWQTAQDLLLQGDYITTVPEGHLKDGIVKEEQIAKVELVYRTGRYDQVYMPYYRFYVELTETGSFNMAEGLKNFGAFYVPAVCGEYLTNFPVWAGQFN